MKTFATLAIFLLAISVASTAWSRPMEKRKWIEATYKDLTIYSSFSKSKTVEMLENLELFRRTVALTTNVGSVVSPIPTKIYAIKKTADYKQFGFDAEAAGVFVPGLRDNTIVVHASRGMNSTQVIQHEYTHFLLRNHSSLNYPKWFDEGTSEYLSATKTRKKYFDIGLVADQRTNDLTYGTWIPIKEIIEPENYADWSVKKHAMYYAEAWLLVHYLVNDGASSMEGKDTFREDMALYLDLVEQGTSDRGAFERAFGITMSELNSEVKYYMRSGKFRYLSVNRKQLLNDFEPEIRVLSREEIS
jgi:hypothetical protein